MRFIALLVFPLILLAQKLEGPSSLVYVPGETAVRMIKVGQVSRINKNLTTRFFPSDLAHAAALNEAIDAKDEYGLKELASTKKAVELDPGDAVLILEKMEDRVTEKLQNLVIRTDDISLNNLVCHEHLSKWPAELNKGCTNIEALCWYSLLIKVRVLSGAASGQICWMLASNIEIPTVPRTQENAATPGSKI